MAPKLLPLRPRRLLQPMALLAAALLMGAPAAAQPQEKAKVKNVVLVHGVRASHAAYISQPDAVADAIDDAARAPFDEADADWLETAMSDASLSPR